jgi:hypothetical protein
MDVSLVFTMGSEYKEINTIGIEKGENRKSIKVAKNFLRMGLTMFQGHNMTRNHWLLHLNQILFANVFNLNNHIKYSL